MNPKARAKENRERLANYIEEHPGIHFMELVRQMDLSQHQISYSLPILEEAGRIFHESNGVKNHYYPISMKNMSKPVPLTPLEQEIVDFIGENPGVTTALMAERFHLTRQTIMYHIYKLGDMGFLWCEKWIGKFHYFPINENYLSEENDEEKEANENSNQINTRTAAEQNRTRLQRYIEKHPGLHLRALRREVKLSLHQTDYGVSILEAEGKVFSEYDGIFKRYFPLSMKDKPKPVALRSSDRRIAEYVRSNPGATIWDMAEEFLQCPEAIDYHLRKLYDGGFVRREKVKGKFHHYYTGKEYL